MRLFKSIFTFQLKKAVNKRNTLVFLLFFGILQIFLQVGKANHNDILESTETFQKQEQQKTSRYLHYGQYGSFGIWLKFIPHANSILFCDSTFDDLFCNVDSTYVFNIYTPVKGRRVFANRSRFLNFSVMFLLLGVLGSLVYGMDITVKKDYLKFLSILTNPKKAFWITIITRLIILFSAILILYGISLVPLLVFNDINLFSASFPILFGIMLLFLFFFGIGGLVGLVEAQFTRVLILVAVYFFMVILLPWLLGFYSEISAKDLPPLIEYDFQNFNVLMQEEENWVKKHGLPKANEAPSEEGIKDYKKGMKYMKRTFRGNEDSLKSQLLAKIKIQQTTATFIPTLFYFSICESSSSAGAINYIDFYDYCQGKKDEFVDFIMEKSFPGKDQPISKKIENFIKGDEDLYFSEPKLPHKFWLGVILTLAYSMVLLMVSYKINKKRMEIPEPKREYHISLEKENVLFTLCENKSIKEDIFNYYQNQREKETVSLGKIETSNFHFNGIKAHELLKHLSALSGVDEKKALDNLTHMSIKGLNGLPVCHEIVLKVYAAVRTAADSKLIVLDDFLKNESRELQKNFFNLLLSLEKSGKKIIYLSCQMKQTANSLEDNIKIDGFKVFSMDLNNTSVR